MFELFFKFEQFSKIAKIWKKMFIAQFFQIRHLFISQIYSNLFKIVQILEKKRK
jgi:hypothetical protein